MKIERNCLSGTINMHYNKKNVIYTIKSTYHIILFVKNFDARIFKLTL